MTGAQRTGLKPQFPVCPKGRASGGARRSSACVPALPVWLVCCFICRVLVPSRFSAPAELKSSRFLAAMATVSAALW